MSQQHFHFGHRSQSPKPPEIHVPDEPEHLLLSSPTWAQLSFLNPSAVQLRQAASDFLDTVPNQQNQQLLLRPGRSRSSISSAGSIASGDSGLCLALGGTGSEVYTPPVVADAAKAAGRASLSGLSQIPPICRRSSQTLQPASALIQPLATALHHQQMPNSHSSPNLYALWGNGGAMPSSPCCYSPDHTALSAARPLLGGSGGQISAQWTNDLLHRGGAGRIGHSEMDLSAYINPDIYSKSMSSQQRLSATEPASNQHPRSSSSASSRRVRHLGQSLSTAALLQGGAGVRKRSGCMELGQSDQMLTLQQQQNNPAYKTVMCQAWLESKQCEFGEQCKFAHGEHELRPARLQQRSNTKYRTKLCEKYTTTGICPFGKRCLFIHPKPLSAVSVGSSVADLSAVIAASSPTFHKGPWNIGQYPYGWPDWDWAGTGVNDALGFNLDGQRQDSSLYDALGQHQQQLDTERAWNDCNPHDEGQFGSHGQFLSVPSPQHDSTQSPLPPFLTRAQTQPLFSGQQLLFPNYGNMGIDGGASGPGHCPHCDHCTRRSNGSGGVSVQATSSPGMYHAPSLGTGMGLSQTNADCIGSRNLFDDDLRHSYSPALSSASQRSSLIGGVEMLGDGSDRASAEDPNQWHRVASLNLLQDDYNPFGGGAIHWNGDDVSLSGSTMASRRPRPTQIRLYPDVAFSNNDSNTLRPPFERDDTLVAGDADSNSNLGAPGDDSSLAPLTPLSYAQCIAEMNSVAGQSGSNGEEDIEIGAIMHRQEEMRKIEEFLFDTHLDAADG